MSVRLAKTQISLGMYILTSCIFSRTKWRIQLEHVHPLAQVSLIWLIRIPLRQTEVHLDGQIDCQTDAIRPSAQALVPIVFDIEQIYLFVENQNECTFPFFGGSVYIYFK